MRKLMILGASLAALAVPAAAIAGVTVNADGTGFVGKGDVQTALGYNNSALQKAVEAKSLKFTAEQPTSRSLTQSVSQSGSQSGTQTGVQSGTQTGAQSATQVVSQDLTCTFTNGNGTKTFHRDGVRDGERTGTREGSRIGTREGVRDGERDGTRAGTQRGTQTGSLAYDLDVEARKANQYTGFILKGWKGQPSYTETGAPVWNDPAFGGWEFGDWNFGGYQFDGDYQFDGGYDFGVWTESDFEPVSGAEWGEWDAAPGENPDDCLRSQNADKITAISNVITPGEITDGEVTDGAITDGAITDGAITEGGITEGSIAYGASTSGAVTPNGPAKVFVNGKAL
jgi:flagellar biosynthesis/type III secretory pathway protein FliH